MPQIISRAAANEYAKLARQLRDALARIEEITDDFDEYRAAYEVESEGDRNLRRMRESVLFMERVPGGYRRACAAEVDAYRRYCVRNGMPIPDNLAVIMGVPISFHLTRGEFVHWTDPAYLANCPKCGADL